jgi:hypothetical protein
VVRQVVHAAAIIEAILLTGGESFRRPALEFGAASNPPPLDSPLPLDHPSFDRLVIVGINDGEVEVGMVVGFGPELLTVR